MSKNRIFIVGHSGAGKGMLAEAVAKKLGWQFINADILGCTTHIGRRTSEVLGESGEHHFYDCLHDILSRQMSEENIVVTTDESIVCDARNRDLLKSAFTVYLEVSISVQMQRGRAGSRPPLLPVEDFKGFIDAIHADRDEQYKEASSFSLSSDDGDIDRHVADVCKAFEVY
ncbi:MAG: AAA family ATPase [Gammaproteobacteria bacterium]|nr:AAA family ATPase [Gammaproteobacteria bacterium]